MRTFFIVLSIVALGIWFVPESVACTCISAGKNATADGSVLTSHTCDSHRTASDLQVIKRAKYGQGTKLMLTRRKEDNSGPMERYAREPTGEISQVEETFAYLAPAYAAMNEFQVGIGESTFGGRPELRSDKGLIDCETLTRLTLERARTAKEAVTIGGALVEKYGWSDEGETLIFTDPNEAWHMEIVGSGKDKVGAIWAARRIPDDHVSVVANGARIDVVLLDRPDEFMASGNVSKVARANGWWDPKSGKPFQFNWAYNPDRASKATTRREWRVLDLLAPSLKLDPEAPEYPFSVKPEVPLTPQRIMEILGDTYEGTEYDMIGECCNVKDEEGKSVKSPVANPFMPYDMNKMLRIDGGWGWRGERPMARWYCMYATVVQSRGQFPDPIGGIVWFAYDNPATTVYVPVRIGVLEVPEGYRTDGRTTGFSHKVAWWAFNRVATIAGHRWGEMRNDVAAVRDPLQKELFDGLAAADQQALNLYKQSPENARKHLTNLLFEQVGKVVSAYWDLGDLLWTKYDEKW